MINFKQYLEERKFNYDFVKTAQKDANEMFKGLISYVEKQSEKDMKQLNKNAKKQGLGCDDCALFSINDLPVSKAFKNKFGYIKIILFSDDFFGTAIQRLTKMGTGAFVMRKKSLVQWVVGQDDIIMGISAYDIQGTIEDKETEIKLPNNEQIRDYAALRLKKLKSFIVHEWIHVMQAIRDPKSHDNIINGNDDLKGYYNSPSELEAHAAQIIQLLSTNEIKEPITFNELLSTIENSGVLKFFKNLTKENKMHVLRLVWDYWKTELKRKDPEFDIPRLSGKDINTYVKRITNMNVNILKWGKNWFRADYDNPFPKRYTKEIDGILLGLKKVRKDDVFKIMKQADIYYSTGARTRKAAISGLNSYFRSQIDSSRQRAAWKLR